MKKSLFCLFIFTWIVPFSQVYAQIQAGANVRLGPEIDVARSELLDDIVGYDGSGYYMLKKVKSEYWLVHFDNNMSQTKTSELGLGYGKKDYKYEAIIQLHNKLYLFSSFADLKNKENILYAQVINKQNLQPEPTRKEIAKMDFKVYKNDGEFHIVLSQDSYKIT